jgi:hypothetical protein
MARRPADDCGAFKSFLIIFSISGDFGEFRWLVEERRGMSSSQITAANCK